MAEATKQWYILRTISGKEQKVKELIEAARRNNSDWAQSIAQVLVPTEKVYTTRAGKKVIKERVLFSGYVFVQAELTGEVENFLQNASNVINFVRSREGGKKPEPVPEHQINVMLGHAEALDERNGLAADDFIVGENVKVNYGPFSGFIGEIMEINAERHELTVMVKVFGRETPLKLDNSQVERAPEQTDVTQA